MFFERFQQYRPYGVPMKWCVRLSFILIVMRYHCCLHFGGRYWQSSSIRRIGRNNFPLLLGRRNGSLCVKRRLAGRTADSVRACFLDNGWTCNMDRTSLLVASLRLCQARFSSFRFLKFREQLCTWSEFGIGNMNFIHEPTLSSGNHNIRCPFSIFRWWKCNFKSILVKIFYDLNFNDWFNNCSSRNCCKDSGLGEGRGGSLEKTYILCLMESTVRNRRPRQV